MTEPGHVVIGVQDDMPSIEPQVKRQLSDDPAVAEVQKQLFRQSEMRENVELLVSMGFEREKADIACIYAQDVNIVVEYLTADLAVDKHNFIRGDHEELCAICFQNRALHTSGVENEVEEKNVVPQMIQKKSSEKEKAETPLEKKDEERMCLICFCPIENDESMAIIWCGHFFCRECISKWIEARASEGKVSTRFIVCPQESCRAPFSEEEIKKFASEDVYLKYARIQQSHLVDQNPNARWCSNPKCSQPVFKPKGIDCCGNIKQTACQCEACGTQMCFSCGKEPHGMFQRCPKIEDENMLNWAGDDVSRCPKCKQMILRTDGCNHMTCSCGQEFCWVCGANYSRVHFSPINPFGCPGMHMATNTGKCLLPITRSFCGRFFFRMLMLIVVLIAVPLGIALQIICLPFWLLFFCCVSPTMCFDNSPCDFCMASLRSQEWFEIWQWFPIFCCAMTVVECFR
jgi:hypothetical protein